ncbi:MAG: hypothetical protein RLZZ403_1571, partial [Pseudomonadota bacterium]
GVVGELLVKEGDRVASGQLIVRLESERARAAVEEARAKVAALGTTSVRLAAELYDRPLEFGPQHGAYTTFIENQRLLYEKRRTAIAAEISTLSQMLSLVSDELSMNEPLLATGDVSRSEVLRLQRQVADINGQIVNRRNRYLQELQAELSKTQEDLASADQVLKQREDQLAHTELRAPVDGIVKNVRLTTVGAVLRPGDEMLQIVPTDDELLLEAKVRPADIGFIRVGQPASVKFDAYDYSIYGSGEGKVSYISADTLLDQSTREEQPYYRVQVAVDTSMLKQRTADEKIEIQPGMTATVEIKTGRSTVLKYLTKPLIKTLSESMTER